MQRKQSLRRLPQFRLSKVLITWNPKRLSLISRTLSWSFIVARTSKSWKHGRRTSRAKPLQAMLSYLLALSKSSSRLGSIRLKSWTPSARSAFVQVLSMLWRQPPMAQPLLMKKVQPNLTKKSKRFAVIWRVLAFTRNSLSTYRTCSMTKLANYSLSVLKNSQVVSLMLS